MIRHYATVCRPEQVRVLLESMRDHCGEFVLHVLAWDYDPPADEPDVYFTLRDFFLRQHPECLTLPGPPRSAVDTVATVRWKFYLDVMETTGQPLLCIDGDQWFWSSPEPMFEEIGRAPFAVSPHRIPQAARGLAGVTFETHRQFGLFNAGLVYVADPLPLVDMAAAAHDWSYTQVRTHPVDGMPDFGDQGALERVAARYGAHVIAHPGVNVAPWNVHGHLLIDGEPPTVDGEPLITYHYSSLRPDRLANPEYGINANQAGTLYVPYLRALDRA